MNTNSIRNRFISYYERLLNQEPLAEDAYIFILEHYEKKDLELFAQAADRIRRKYYGNTIYIRGLIEFSNYCKNDCYYCGIQNRNHNINRYRLSKEEILSCCVEGYTLGFRTFVLQSGEDPYYNDDRMCDITSTIRKQFPDCAITLSMGERSYDSYQKLFAAGANRYLLRHETADKSHYQKLHPDTMSFDNRMECLIKLKEIGFQVGCGFMVGSPFQTPQTLAKDLAFIQSFQPDMVGIGPFLSQKDTPFSNKKNGTLEETLLLLSILRLQQPTLLLPATTALGTIHPKGREYGIMAGANVVMPNLSPLKNRENYCLYDNKISTGEESAHAIDALKLRMKQIGYDILTDRGDGPIKEELCI